MKRKLLLLITAGFAFEAMAQQAPQYTQFNFNKQLYNPATTGFNGKHCASLLARTQYTNYQDQTYTLNDELFDEPLDLFSSRGARTLTFSYGAPIPFARAPKGVNSGGAGISVFTDKAGYLGTTYIKLDGAFKRNLASGSSIAFGVNVGGMQKDIDLNGLSAKDPGDPRIPTDQQSNVQVNFGAGVWYNDPINGFSLGYAIQNLNTSPFAFGTVSPIAPGVHQYINVGYENLPTPVPVDLNLLVKTSQEGFGFANPDFSLNALAEVTQDLEIGLAFRTSFSTFESMALLLGYNLNEKLRLGYAFDLNTAQLRNNNNNTHEIVLNYCFTLQITPPPIIRLVDPRRLDRDDSVE